MGLYYHGSFVVFAFSNLSSFISQHVVSNQRNLKLFLKISWDERITGGNNIFSDIGEVQENHFTQWVYWKTTISFLLWHLGCGCPQYLQLLAVWINSKSLWKCKHLNHCRKGIHSPALQITSKTKHVCGIRSNIKQTDLPERMTRTGLNMRSTEKNI